MPAYILTAKPETTDSQLQQMKDDIKAKGGKIEQEYTLIKGFSYTLPEGSVIAMNAHPLVESVEADQIVTTQ